MYPEVHLEASQISMVELSNSLENVSRGIFRSQSNINGGTFFAKIAIG